MLRRLIPSIFALFLLSVPQAAAQRAAPPPRFDAYVEQVMRTFAVPGAAVAIVKDGQVLLAKGYGVRTLGGTDRVDARTQFGIASNTKIVTSTALALLVEEGKVEWDAPVIRYLPWFAMYDPYVTRELTVRDLLVHRSGLGLGAGDLLWWPPSTYDRKEIARRLRYIRPATSFRSAYAYDNVLYLIAAEVIETASGLSWEDFVRTRILARVGMSSSDARHPGATEVRSRNIAVTHAEVNDTVRVIAPFASDNTNPAGGIMSGAEDMARWVIVQLDSGRLGNGSRLYSPASARQLWRDVTPTGLGGAPPGFTHLRANFSGYALGLGVRDYRGVKLLQHTGGLPGYVSKVAMIPEHRLGVVVLTNQESGFAFESIIYHVLDHYLGATPAPDYLGHYTRLRDQFAAELRTTQQAVQAKRDTASRPSLPLAGYAGTYRDDWYGDVVLAMENGKLAIRFTRTPLLVGDLDHWQHDSFLVRWRDRELRADAYITFALNPDGTIDVAKMAPASPAVDFSFDFQDLLLRPVR